MYINCCFCFDIQNNFGTQHVLQMLRASEKDLPVLKNNCVHSRKRPLSTSKLYFMSKIFHSFPKSQSTKTQWKVGSVKSQLVNWGCNCCKKNQMRSFQVSLLWMAFLVGFLLAHYHLERQANPKQNYQKILNLFLVFWQDVLLSLCPGTRAGANVPGQTPLSRDKITFSQEHTQ